MKSNKMKLGNGLALQYHLIIDDLTNESNLENPSPVLIDNVIDISKFIQTKIQNTKKVPEIENNIMPHKKDNEIKNHYKTTGNFLSNLRKEAGKHFIESHRLYGSKEINWLYNRFLDGYYKHLKRETTTNKIDDLDLIDRLAAESVSDAISSTYKPYRENIENKIEHEEFKIKPGEELKYSRIPQPKKQNEFLNINDAEKKDVVMICSNEEHYKVKHELEQIANFSIIKDPKELNGTIDLLIIYTDNDKYRMNSVFEKMFEQEKGNNSLTRHDYNEMTIKSVLIFSENEQKSQPIYRTCNVKNGVKGLKKKVLKVLYEK